VLGCFLHSLALQPEVQRDLIFKGGTSLQKCHFPEYRFSEDLDFTATSAFSASTIQRLIDEAKSALQESIGIRTDTQETVVETIADDYGKESYEAKLYYEGPWKYGGTPRSLRIHISRDEQLSFSPKILPIMHNDSDILFRQLRKHGSMRRGILLSSFLRRHRGNEAPRKILNNPPKIRRSDLLL